MTYYCQRTCKFTVKYIEQYAVRGYNKISMKDVNDYIKEELICQTSNLFQI